MIERESFWIRSIGKSIRKIIKIAIKFFRECLQCAKINFLSMWEWARARWKRENCASRKNFIVRFCMIETKNQVKLYLNLKLCLVACEYANQWELRKFAKTLTSIISLFIYVSCIYITAAVWRMFIWKFIYIETKEGIYEGYIMSIWSEKCRKS